MLKSSLLHPELLRALAGAGHGSKVLIADGNYPYGTGGHPEATRVYLNLAPGLLNVVEVLKVVAGAIPVEAAEVIVPDDGPEPPVHGEFRQVLGKGLPLQPLRRFPFYDAARDRNTTLVIATGEQRIYACILLTIGVVPPP